MNSGLSSERDQHLFGPGPKRILALDGGGTRGIVTIAFLARMEATLAARAGTGDFRLCDYFDLIGGTSTGAIIAAGLALGMRVAEVARLYTELAPRAFRRVPWRIPGIAAAFDTAPLDRLLRAHLGDRTLESNALRTGLAVMTKRLDTGSPWLVSNNPRAPFWEDAPDGSWCGNRHYWLPALVRASTAAPGYFRPELLHIMRGAPPGLFVDGGVSPFNNPSLALLMLGTVPAFGLRWSVGPRSLLMVSVGTGGHRHAVSVQAALRGPAFGLAAQALLGVIADGQALTLALLQWMSACPAPWPVNAEVGHLAGDWPGGEPLLQFQRYDLPLEPAWLRGELGVELSNRDLTALRRLDNPAAMPRLHALAERAAVAQVAEAHFLPAFDLAPSQSANAHAQPAGPP